MFKFGVDLRSAFRQLRTYPVESALIVIALAVGIGALSAVAALYGVNDEIAKRLRADLASREFAVVPATLENSASLQGDRLIAPLRAGQATNFRFQLTDLSTVKELAPSVDHVYFFESRAFYAAAANLVENISFVYAISADYTKAAGAIEVARGSWFSQADFDEARRVLVLSESQAARLGIKGDPLGQELPMNYADAHGAPFTVIGIVSGDQEPAPRYGLTMVGYVPATDQVSGYAPARLYAAVKDPRHVPQATEELQRAVDRIWNGQAALRPPPSLWQASTAERNRALLLAGFASASLLMASLNITNLMLARVRRRERAIAILRSLGATRANIRAQILTEAGVLGLLGGLLGVIFSEVLLRTLIATAAPGQAQLFGTASLPPVVVVVTLVASAAVTMIIGMAPAARAASSTLVPGSAAVADLAPGLPKPLRRNPARLVLTILQMVVSGAAIVIGLHVLAVGNASKPELKFFHLEALNQGHNLVRPVFTPQRIDSFAAVVPSATALLADEPDYNGGLVTVSGQKYVIDGIRLVGPNYLSLVGANVIAGSPLSGRTDGRSQEELLLEESVAKELFSTVEAALGKELTIGHRGTYPFERAFEVIGVYSYAAAESAFGPPERVPAITNHPRKDITTILAAATPGKVDEAKDQLIAAAKAAYGETYTDELGTGSLDFVTYDAQDQSRLQTALDQAVFLFTLMAITAVILAAVGIFSLSILNTAEQTRDIGIRRALGASKGQVAREIAGSAAFTAAVSAILGIAIAWLVSPNLSKTLSDSLLAGIRIPQHVSLALATLGIVLALSALLGWLVGFRATQASPSAVLSEEGI